MKKYTMYALTLLLLSSLSAHAMKLNKFDKNMFKSKKIHSEKFLNNKLLKHDTLKYIKTIHVLDTHDQKQLFHTTLPIIHNNNFKTKTIKTVDDKNSVHKQKCILLKIKENPQEFIRNFIKIKTLKETSEKNVYLNGIGQKLFYNSEDKQFYFDPREVRIQNNGPILGCIGYFGTKILAYGTLAAGLGTATVATGGAAGGVAAMALAGAQGAVAAGAGIAGAGAAAAGVTSVVAATAGTTAAMVAGGAGYVAIGITGAGLAPAAASVTIAATAVVGAGGVVAGIESAATSVGWFLACIPWLP